MISRAILTVLSLIFSILSLTAKPLACVEAPSLNCAIVVEEIAELYKQRWQIELFFKWIKQNLKIKKFLGKSENAVKTQICIAIIAFVLIRLMQNLKEFCKKVPLKTLITIAKNGLFTKLSTKLPSKKHSESFKQLHFNLILDG